MRLRFSLRLAFLLLTLVAVALYVLYVRPTSIAERFVNAVEQRDYEASRSLLVNNELSVFNHGPKYFVDVDFLYAEIMPREWSDLLKCRRRLLFRIGDHDYTNGYRVESTSDFDALATPRGITFDDFLASISQNIVHPEEPMRVPDYTLVP